MSRRTDRGMALVMVTMTLLLLTTLGAVLALTTSSEVLMAANFRASHQALYSADAAVEWAVVDLPAVVDDWGTLLHTAVKSWFVDGIADGLRDLPDGSSIDLGAIVRQNAAWKPYAYGLLKDLLPSPGSGIESSAFYVVVFVSSDPASSDRLKVRAEAHGPRGAHKVVEMSVLRDSAGVRPVSWTDAP